MLFQRDPGVTSTESNGDFVLTGRAPGQVLYLDQTASMVWRIIATPHSAEDVVNSFVEAFPTSPREQMDRELRKFLATLVEHELALTLALPDEDATGAAREA